MGNRWATYDTKIFNPPESPFLHVYRGAYVPSVGNDLFVLLGCQNNKNVDRILEEIVVTPLLPPIKEIPVPADVASHIDLAVSRLFDEYHLLSSLEQQHSSNTLHVIHGAKWGQGFVTLISARLQHEGYAINFEKAASLGRGKRISHSCLAFYHPSHIPSPETQTLSPYLQPMVYGF